MSLQKSPTESAHTEQRVQRSGSHWRAKLHARLRDDGEAGRSSGLPRILIIDGNVDAAVSLASLLRHEHHGGETRISYLGKAALSFAVEYLPTLVFVELDLPDMTGYEVARLLSQHPRLRNVRMIALTGSSDHPGRELARAAGFDRYLIKPVTAAALDELMLLDRS